MYGRPHVYGLFVRFHAGPDDFRGRGPTHGVALIVQKQFRVLPFAGLSGQSSFLRSLRHLRRDGLPFEADFYAGFGA